MLPADRVRKRLRQLTDGSSLRQSPPNADRAKHHSRSWWWNLLIPPAVECSAPNCPWAISGQPYGDGIGNASDLQLKVNVPLGVEIDPTIVSRADLNRDTARNALDLQ